MKNIFSNINEDEYRQLVKAIAKITVFIAGADDNIDEDEREWAQKLTEIRSYVTPEELNEFYKDVGATFGSDVDSLIQRLPSDTKERTQILADELESLNKIMSKLPSKTGADLYKSYTSFSKHVAKASGGFLRFFSVSKEEKNLMGLDMITPIFFEEEEQG